MTEEQKAAYVFAQSVAAMAEIAGMEAENASRQRRGEALAYVKWNFDEVIERYGLHHNAVLRAFEP